MKLPKMKFTDPSFHHIEHESKESFRGKSRSKSRAKSPVANLGGKIDPSIMRDMKKFSPKPISPSPRKYRNDRSRTYLVNGDRVMKDPENVLLQRKHSSPSPKKYDFEDRDLLFRELAEELEIPLDDY